MKIKALIIEDEPLARNVIVEYSKKIEFLEIVCSCEDALQGLDKLNDTTVDLLFLDINMPHLSGIAFLKSLKNPPLVIITSAYSEYALEGYELNVVDYLKKPFSFERFLKAIQKASEYLKIKNQPTALSEETKVKKASSDDFVFIKANKKAYKVGFKEILFVEGLGDYLKIHTKTQHLITNLTMKKIQDILPADNFYRIHKSFIIALDKMEIIEGNLIVIGSHKIPIGNNYRQEFFDMVNQKLPG
jgi:DNA-binding LytR/AlgR family response regulator